MFNMYGMEWIIKARLAEERKERMTRTAIRQAFGEQRARISLLERIKCQLSNILVRIGSRNNYLAKPIAIRVASDPCLEGH